MSISRYRVYACAAFMTALLGHGSAQANGYLESRAWQFETSTDKANKAVIVDIIERKKGGYYDSFAVINTYNTTTNIGRQYNCDVAASSVGNSGSNGMTANSPNVGNTASTGASTTGNSAHNGSDNGGRSRIGNEQSNEDSWLSSEVDDSSSSASSGPINVGDSRQILNSDQRNSGNQRASIANSQACAFASN